MRKERSQPVKKFGKTLRQRRQFELGLKEEQQKWLREERSNLN